MSTPCHIIVEHNPALIYSSRNGVPSKVMPVLRRFLDTFWQEREVSGESVDTPGCLVAQIVVRFGFESCEDDFSNLRVSPQFAGDAEYLYVVRVDQTLEVWLPTDAYRENPQLGLEACRVSERVAVGD